MAITSDVEALARQDEAPAVAMIPGHRAGFGRGGYLIIGGVLTPEQAGCCAAALDRVCDEQAAAGDVNPDGPVHVLSPVGAAAGRPG